MKKEVKRIVHFCDEKDCKQEIEEFNVYINTCVICHKEFCKEHIATYKNDALFEDIAVCDQCFERLTKEFEKYIKESEQE